MRALAFLRVYWRFAVLVLVGAAIIAPTALWGDFSTRSLTAGAAIGGLGAALGEFWAIAVVVTIITFDWADARRRVSASQPTRVLIRASGGMVEISAGHGIDRDVTVRSFDPADVDGITSYIAALRSAGEQDAQQRAEARRIAAALNRSGRRRRLRR